MQLEPGPDDVVGWRVIDPDGNVVAWGPPTELQMVSSMGDPEPQEEEAEDGSD